MTDLCPPQDGRQSERAGRGHAWVTALARFPLTGHRVGMQVRRPRGPDDAEALFDLVVGYASAVRQATGAFRLYESVGMRTGTVHDCYQLMVPAGEPGQRATS